MNLLPKRWTPLRYHAVQWRLRQSQARFKIVAAGRRSGKTEHCKREGIELAMAECELPNYRAVYSAPTHDQARELYWDDLKRLVPRWFMARPPLEAKAEIQLINGAKIQVRGMDKPERMEGSPLDWIAVDEFGNCKAHVWEAHILPALYTEGRRAGRGWLLGVPEGRNHYFRIYTKALEDIAEHGDASEYGVFTWPSSDILPPEEIARRKRGMDPLTFAQEYEASFVNFGGRAYYQFDRAVHAAERVNYVAGPPLILMFDFNVEPGTAVIGQEQRYFPDAPSRRPEVLRQITAILGEVHIPSNSDTPAVVRRIISDWGSGGAVASHQGEVYVYGDPTGGNRGTAKISGSDWDIVFGMLRAVPGWDVISRVKSRTGPERPRINATNTRLRNTAGEVGMLVDPVRCKETVLDFEGVKLLEGGTGEINKKHDKKRTHWTDGVGYYAERAHPIFTEGGGAESQEF